MDLIRKVDESMLFVSEPHPRMFGNGPNTPKEKGWTNENWLKSRFHFSFAEYRSSRNSNFGVLRVMNDDLVQPARGFGAHPHGNMEIVTYVVDGELTHKDSTGNEETLGRGSVQFMSAGKGVVHSEKNLNEEKPVRFIQMWVPPREFNVDVNYGSLEGNLAERHNKWQHLVSDKKSSFKTPIKIYQDANFYVAEMDPGKSLEFGLAKDRQAYFLCVEGSVTIAAKGADGASASSQLVQHDGAELFGESKLRFTVGDQGGHLLIVEMKKDGSSRFNSH